MKTINTLGYSINEYTILAQAQELKQDASIVLPILNVIVHPYTEFVINWVLILKKDSIENIISELKFINNPERLDFITIVIKETSENYHEIAEDLINKGSKYLNQFIIYNSNLIGDDDY